MLLVIFGAGASYDSVDESRMQHMAQAGNVDYKPPLAVGLFERRQVWDDIIGNLPECAAMVDALRIDVSNGKQVEQALDEYQQRAEGGDSVLTLYLAATRFYIQSVIWRCNDEYHERATGITNYVTLLRKIRDWNYSTKEQVVFITFNYDTLLEEASRRALLWPVESLASYTPKSLWFTFIKPHGSVNWGHPIGGNYSPTFGWPDKRDIVRQSASLLFSDNAFELIGRLDGLTSGGSRWLPAMALPITSKRIFECPSEQLQALDECLPKVRRVLVIGWRATEQHFLQKLKDGLHTPLPLQIVAGSREWAKEPAEHLSPYGIQGEPLLLTDGGFSSFVVGGALDDLLNA